MEKMSFFVSCPGNKELANFEGYECSAGMKWKVGDNKREFCTLYYFLLVFEI